MDYTQATVENLLTDEHFISYCLQETPEAVAFWKNILKQNPALASKSAEAEQLFFILSVKLSPDEKAKELSKLKYSIEQSEQESSPGRAPALRTWISAAAAILICVGMFAVFSRKDGRNAIPSQQEFSKAQTLKTEFNERRTVSLPDGSTVILNGLTELKIDANYNKENRVLWLKGEAFFSVAKNKDKPFIVISGKTATTALGTSFKINNYKAEEPVSVMLTTGKVSLGTVAGQKIDKQLELLPGEKAEVTASANSFVKSTFELSEVDNWNNRRLTFAMASLREIKQTLKAVYGVDIDTANQPNKPIAFTGQFTNQGLTEVLDAIGFTNHFSYTINHNKIMLEFKK